MSKVVDDLLKTSEFKAYMGQIFKDDKRDIIITDREYRRDKSGKNRRWYKYTCNKCGWTEGWIREIHLLGGKNGCSCCYGRTAVLGINTIWDTDRWMVELGVSEENAKKHTHGSRNKIAVTCPDCKKTRIIRISDVYNKHTILCNCSDKISYPNKFSYSLLKQLSEIYGFEHLEHEYSPEWIKRKRYDNYFIYNGKQYILEMDGGWHKVDNKISGQTVEQSKEIDDYKDKMARDHNIEVIRIDCEKSELEFIKQNILNSKLSELFDLLKIDWTKCEKFALSNRIKEACTFKRNNPNIVTKEIAEIMGITYQTVIMYLKKGNNLGWCVYNAREEISKNSRRNGKIVSKQVEIFKDKISLGIFPSCSELERRSENLFGFKLSRHAISLVYRGKQKQYKGFTFKYINEIEQAI